MSERIFNDPTGPTRRVTWERREQGGYLVHVPAGVISSADLKYTLDSVASGQYEVQV
jgi:hypothetical protein